MPLPQPQPGLVIHYEYLWREEREAGREGGSKGRPCAIVLASTTQEGKTEVVVAPITHVQPRAPTEGILIPARVKRHLGLDDQSSWIILTDLNAFTWPGVDLYPVPSSPTGSFSYGFIPPALFNQIRERIQELNSTTPATRRTE